MRSTEVYNMLAHTSMLTSREQSPNPSPCLQNKVWCSWEAEGEKESREERRNVSQLQNVASGQRRERQKLELITSALTGLRRCPAGQPGEDDKTSRERSEEKKLNGMSLEAVGTFYSAVGLWRDKRSEEVESPPCDRCLSFVPRDVYYCRDPSLKRVPAADWTPLPRSGLARRSVPAHQLMAPAKVLPRYSSRASLRTATTEERLCVGEIKLDESLRVKPMIFTSRLLWSCLN